MKKNVKKQNSKGFSLAEILVVGSILGILSMASIYMNSNQQKFVKQQKYKTDFNEHIQRINKILDNKNLCSANFNQDFNKNNSSTTSTSSNALSLSGATNLLPLMVQRGLWHFGFDDDTGEIRDGTADLAGMEPEVLIQASATSPDPIEGRYGGDAGGFYYATAIELHVGQRPDGTFVAATPLPGYPTGAALQYPVNTLKIRFKKLLPVAHSYSSEDFVFNKNVNVLIQQGTNRLLECTGTTVEYFDEYCRTLGSGPVLTGDPTDPVFIGSICNGISIPDIPATETPKPIDFVDAGATSRASTIDPRTAIIAENLAAFHHLHVGSGAVPAVGEGSLSVKTGLYATENIFGKNNLEVGGPSTVGGIMTVNAVSNMTAAKTFSAANTFEAKGPNPQTFTISGAPLLVNGNVNNFTTNDFSVNAPAGSFVVLGNNTIDIGNVNTTNAINGGAGGATFAGVATINGIVNISPNLNSNVANFNQGSVSIGENLTVGGTTTINGTLTINNAPITLQGVGTESGLGSTQRWVNEKLAGVNAASVTREQIINHILSTGYSPAVNNFNDLNSIILGSTLSYIGSSPKCAGGLNFSVGFGANGTMICSDAAAGGAAAATNCDCMAARNQAVYEVGVTGVCLCKNICNAQMVRYYSNGWIDAAMACVP